MTSDQLLGKALLREEVVMAFTNSFDEEEWTTWDCIECDAGPPPAFLLPPPPCPSDFELSGGVLPPISCPSALRAQENPLSQEQNIQLEVVFVTAGALLLLSSVIAIVVCGYRVVRSRSHHKQCSSSLNGAIIYDDLNSSSPSHHPMSFYGAANARGPHILQHFPSNFNDGCKAMQQDAFPTTIFRYTSEPRRLAIPAEHLYSSISSGSGSENYTISTSDGVSSEGRSLLPSSHSRFSPAHTNTDSEEDDSLSPFLRPIDPAEDSDSLQSPCHGRHYLNVPLTSLRPAMHRPKLAYESLPMGLRGRNMTSSLTSTGNLGPIEGHSDLPPLPSRRDKFKIYSTTSRGYRPQRQDYHSPRREPLHLGRRTLDTRFSHIYENT